MVDHNDLRTTQESFFQYLAMMVTACFVGNVWLGSFLVLNVFLYIYNGQQVGNMQVINIMLGCLLFLFARNFFKANKFSEYYKFIVGIALVSITFQYLQLLRLDPIFMGKFNGGGPMIAFTDPVGMFAIKEAAGTYLNLALPMAVSMNPLLGLVFLHPLYLSQSSGVILATVVIALFYTFYLHRRVFLVLLMLLPIGGAFYIYKDLHTDPKTFTSRFPVWHSAIKYTFTNPYGWCGLIGYGPDSYRNLSAHKPFKFIGDNEYHHAIMIPQQDGSVLFSYYSPTNNVKYIEKLNSEIGNKNIAQGRVDEWDSPHNELVDLFFQYGLLGVILLAGLLREMFFRFKYAMKDKELIVITSCLLVYAVTGLLHFPLHLARTGYLFPLLLGSFYASTDPITKESHA